MEVGGAQGTLCWGQASLWEPCRAVSCSPSVLLVVLKEVACQGEGLSSSLSLCFCFSILIFQGFSVKNWNTSPMGCRDSLRNIQMDLNFSVAKGFAYLFSVSCCLLCLRAFARSFAYVCPSPLLPPFENTLQLWQNTPKKKKNPQTSWRSFVLPLFLGKLRLA